MDNEAIKSYYDRVAADRLAWMRKNHFYNRYLQRHFSFMIPARARVLELGCSTGDLLNAVEPGHGVGVDFSGEMIKIASSQFPHLRFVKGDVTSLSLNETFDYIIISDLLHILWDIQSALKQLRQHSHSKSKIIISNYSYLWQPVLRGAARLKLKQRDPNANWLSHHDIFNLLEIEGFQVIKHERKLLLPKHIPGINFLVNKILANLPGFNSLALVNFIVARPIFNEEDQYTVSIIIPAKNEKGNINNAVKRIPKFGRSQEIIFIEGNSADDTWEEMQRVKAANADKNIKIIRQSGRGKGNAVREGFEAATGEVLIILDADLTTPPEELPKFYEALASRKGEFINGCRLVYPMEKRAMQFLNLVANKSFSIIFTYLLGQHVKDTLCGTKVLLRSDYVKIQENRKYFGDFDPFGDFDLLFGAAKLNLKIVEVFVRYKDRQYGTTQISRFKHGWLLLKMTWFAAWKIKFL